LLNINTESDLFRETKNILDELSVITLIKDQGMNASRIFSEHVQYLLTGSKPEIFSIENINERQHLLPSGSGVPNTPMGHAIQPIHLGDMRNSEDIKLTLSSSQTLLKTLQDQIQELSSLTQAAKDVSLSLKDLLDLKQQQASVVEAREGVKQTLSQGRSIMLFTIITIIFLPLSFFTGVFGMNATNLTGAVGDDLYTWGDIFKYMIPLSALVIICSLLFVFSTVVRAVFSFAFNVSWAWLKTSTPIYRAWLYYYKNGARAKEKEKHMVTRMEIIARRQRV